MPGASIRKATSTAHGFLDDNPQQILLRRALSTRQTPCDVTTGDADENFLTLRSIDSAKSLSNSTNSLKKRPGSVKLRNSRDRSIPRPASLDLSSFNQMINPPSPVEIRTTPSPEEQLPGLVMPKRNHLTIFAPEAAQRTGSLRFRKGRRKRALRRSLVRSATIVGETIKAPFGDYLKESWDAFLTKITERQSELKNQVRMERKKEQHKFRNLKKGLQALDACDWLVAAGFPQYSHIYKAGDFPLNILSAAKDHVFLEEEEIEALIKRLSILNKCANLKLDRSLSREALDDQEEEEEYEHYAISERWFLEENGRRWARTDETATLLDSPSLENRIILGRARTEDNTTKDNNNSAIKSVRNLHPHQDIPSLSGDDSPVTEKPQKQKGRRFLKRFQGDLKKLSSFKKREFLQRSNSADKAQEHSPRSDRLHFSSSHGLRKNHKVVIGQPTLEEGYERVDQMKCVPIYHPACLAHGHHMGRKNSSHSLISTSSSGAGSITSTSGSRTNPSADGYPCLECLSLFEAAAGASKGLKEREHSQERDNSLYLAPPSHKPGLFPTALQEQSESKEVTPAFSAPSSESSSRSHSTSDVTGILSDSSRKLPRSKSIYDNLDDTELCTLTQDFLSIFDLMSPLDIDDETDLFEDSAEILAKRVPGVDVAFWSVDDIVEHTQSLQQMVQSWQSDEEKCDETTDSNECVSVPQFLASSDAVPSVSSENASTTESETEAIRSNHVEQLEQLKTKWETLKRSMPVREVKKIDVSQLHSLSAGQLMILRRLAVLKLTASMEKFSNKTSHSWSVPRFMRRFKVPDYKDKAIFGVPLLNNMQQFGQALPPCIQHALNHLRNTSLQQIGIFRKPGVRLRIEKLRLKCEDNSHFKDFDTFSAFDVSDLVKKYFRELPDPLMTVKLSDTFVGIFLNICQELRLTILQAAILLLPDENREALKAFLHFLREVASNASENQMSASNLSTCLAPSLFHLQINSTKLTTSSSSPKLKKSQMGKPAAAIMKPNMKEMNDNKAATQCLTFMIENIETIFKIPEDTTTQCRMSVMHQDEDVLACEIGSRADAQDTADYMNDYHARIDNIVAQTTKDEQKLSQNKSGSWQNATGPPGTEVMYKKFNDGNPLRLWRSKIEINNASPDEVLNRILNERKVWDDNLVQCEVLEQPDNRTQVVQTVVKEMHPHPSRDYCVLRTWRRDIGTKASTVVVESSTTSQPLIGDVRGVVLTSRYVIEPSDSTKKCSLVHICRIDMKGHNPEWYNKTYGHFVARNLIKIRDSFYSNVSKAS